MCNCRYFLGNRTVTYWLAVCIRYLSHLCSSKRMVAILSRILNNTPTIFCQSLRGWVLECNRQGLNDNVPRIVIGNKCDESAKITITTNIAQRFADQHNMPVSLWWAKCKNTKSFTYWLNEIRKITYLLMICIFFLFEIINNSTFRKLGNRIGCRRNIILDYTFLQLFETSAKAESECDHVESIFLTLAHKLRQNQLMKLPALGAQDDKDMVGVSCTL